MTDVLWLVARPYLWPLFGIRSDLRSQRPVVVQEVNVEDQTFE